MSAQRPPSDPEGRFSRPDASMSLLTSVMDHSLDEGYAEAAAARGAVGSSRIPSSTKGRLVLALGLALVTAVVTISAVDANEDRPTLAKEHDALVQRVTDETTAADTLQHQVESLRDQVDQAQQRALKSAGGDGGLAVLAGSVGTGALRGPGLKLVIDDAAGTDNASAVDPRTADGFSGGRLHDRDLQLVVNGLWQAGAEAVSINGQRLTALSAIRAAGDAILVDNRPLVPPYTVLSIGDSRKLTADFQNGVDGQYLRVLQTSYGIKYSVAAQHSLDLPAAVGFTLRLAQPDVVLPSPSVSPGPSSTGASTP
ncbi:uncharacterized protein YlxW (UPF0749 family) [Kitasatospora sp. MAP12-15]|uniref:DUF881 domain-containing protein n=1 Tax=unclassified Kitasatospora TaxID=2633591 RepID=UPI0024731CFA|nr:DUF881 domain-containing protein [Kitasatospora sp. MAP12-44]MDH6109018.1 uncharacterized protein YlxW (UPF0749 family) [Kitasatospora sp. MAP12-44]